MDMLCKTTPVWIKSTITFLESITLLNNWLILLMYIFLQLLHGNRNTTLKNDETFSLTFNFEYKDLRIRPVVFAIYSLIIVVNFVVMQCNDISS